VRLAALALVVASGLHPPVIHERFTVLPCPMHPTDTLAQEGCIEHAIVATDRSIDRRASAIFRVLHSQGARASFVTGERAWLRYRQASCEAESSNYEGGTLAGVVAASCTLERSKAHLRELQAMQKTLRSP
jgi:uncharacterized protein YecT (DUF1311 family)